MASQQPYRYQSQYAQSQAKTETTAIAALVCSIVGFFAFPAAIVALVLIPGARRKIAASGGTLEGENLCRIATIISWVVLALAAVGLVLFLIFAVFLASTFHGVTNDMNRVFPSPSGVILLLGGGGLS